MSTLRHMDVVQALTGSGGWPSTIFVTPALKPFFAGTYIPKLDARRGTSASPSCASASTSCGAPAADDLEEQAAQVTDGHRHRRTAQRRG